MQFQLPQQQQAFGGGANVQQQQGVPQQQFQQQGTLAHQPLKGWHDVTMDTPWISVDKQVQNSLLEFYNFRQVKERAKRYVKEMMKKLDAVDKVLQTIRGERHELAVISQQIGEYEIELEKMQEDKDTIYQVVESTKSHVVSRLRLSSEDEPPFVHFRKTIDGFVGRVHALRQQVDEIRGHLADLREDSGTEPVSLESVVKGHYSEFYSVADKLAGLSERVVKVKAEFLTKFRDEHGMEVPDPFEEEEKRVKKMERVSGVRGRQYGRGQVVGGGVMRGGIMSVPQQGQYGMFGGAGGQIGQPQLGFGVGGQQQPGGGFGGQLGGGAQQPGGGLVFGRGQQPGGAVGAQQPGGGLGLGGQQQLSGGFGAGRGQFGQQTSVGFGAGRGQFGQQTSGGFGLGGQQASVGFGAGRGGFGQQTSGGFGLGGQQASVGFGAGRGGFGQQTSVGFGAQQTIGGGFGTQQPGSSLFNK